MSEPLIRRHPIFLMLPDRLKLDLSFSPERLQADLERLVDKGWIDNFVTHHYEGDSNILPLRGPRGAEHPVMMAYSDPTCTDFADTPFLGQCPYFQEVLSAFPFELHSVRLMGLSPGSRIKEHSDHDLALEYGAVRIHIPIQTNDLMEFYLNNSRVKMHEGECWYLRLSDPHRVYNGGTENRVHMVIDAPASPEASDFLHRNFEAA